MEYEDEDLKILELINRGVKTFRDIKNILKVKNEELEKTLGILDKSQMIKTTTKTGLLGQKKIVLELTCLLYTSPSPRDRQKSRMPSSA